jgi:myo-inositol-1(or 4)-monophosphatase
MSPAIDDLLSLAIAAAAAGGALLLRGQPGARQVDAKSSPTDVVTQMDRESEQAIVDHLRQHRPADAVLGEEAGERAGTSGLRWVIDPLDGTVNYLYGLPLWGVSVAVESSDGALAGAVAVPALGITYAAGRGTGAWGITADDRREQLAVRECGGLPGALVATGFGYRAERRADQGRALAQLIDQIRDVRRCGAAALDLCWLAAGHYDGYFERGLQQWDAAAGVLIAREAGAIVTGATDGEPDGEFLVGAVPAIHAELRRALVGAGAHRGR